MVNGTMCMFDLLKMALLAFGFVAVYGLATGANLNDLFVTVGDSLIPAAKEATAGIIEFIKEQMK